MTSNLFTQRTIKDSSHNLCTLVLVHLTFVLTILLTSLSSFLVLLLVSLTLALSSSWSPSLLPFALFVLLVLLFLCPPQNQLRVFLGISSASCADMGVVILVFQLTEGTADFNSVIRSVTALT